MGFYERNFSISMFDNSPLAFCVIRVDLDENGEPVDWTFLYCNEALAEIEGRPQNELLGHRFYEMFPKCDRDWVKPYYKAAYEKIPIEFDTFTLIEGKYLHVNCIPLDEPGLCGCMLRIMQSEEDYKRSLEDKMAEFKNIHEALGSGSWALRYDTAGKLIECSWSDTFRKMLGFESLKDFPNEFESWKSRIHPDDKEYTLREYYESLWDYNNKKTYDVEYRVQNKDGTYHWYRTAGRLSRRADGSPITFNGVFVNTDEIHETNEKLHKALKEAQDARNELIIDNEIISSVSRLYFSIYRIDIEKDFYEEISSNSRIHRLTGHEGKAQRKLNKLCNSIVTKEYRASARRFFNLSTLAERLADTDTIEMDYHANDGNWYEARFIEKKRDDNGKVTHVLYVTRIVSKQKQQELEQEQLKIAYEAAERANEAKTTFLFNMSHDIRTPMNAILGYTKLIKKEITDPKLLHYQEMIEKSGNLLLSIINNVLDMSRIESGKMELDINYSRAGVITSEICDVFAEDIKKKNLTLKRVVNVRHEHIMMDKTKVQEIFTNLISNAVKYTPPGGTITITIDEIPCDKEGYVTFKSCVADNGIGMSEEFPPHIFDSFSRERNTTVGGVVGTGLGMSIVKSLVDLMEGTIEVESKTGEGSRFTVVLQHKLADEEYYEKRKAADVKTDMNFSGKHILLAEDNDLNAEIATAMLEDMGFAVDRAEDGVICINRIEHMPSDTYDLILMDIQMPNMDGYKATKIIRRLPDKEKAGIPIVAMTANAFDEDKREAFAAGMNGHIAKPIDTEKIQNVLSEVIK